MLHKLYGAKAQEVVTTGEPRNKKAKNGVPKLTILQGQRVPIKDLFPLHAGNSKAETLFVTGSMVDILEIFDERVNNGEGIWFAGAPGMGKSQLGRLWATCYAQRGKQVLYGETRWGRYWLTQVEPDGWSQSEVGLEKFSPHWHRSLMIRPKP